MESTLQTRAIDRRSVLLALAYCAIAAVAAGAALTVMASVASPV